MKYLSFVGALLALMITAFEPIARAQLSTRSLTDSIYGYKICTGTYALCAASTCAPTGETINVNTATGTASFPAATCTCPVFDGPAIADPNGGNMQGTCKPPGNGQVWSLYAPKTNIPQAVNNWSHKSSETAVTPQLCSSSVGVGATFANCFSFACTLDPKRVNGVKTATCTCPLGEDLNGEPVDPDTTIIIDAGQCDSSFCAQHPVGAPLTALNGQSSECLGTESSADLDLSPNPN
jgi:hypothetical protein